MSPHFIDIRQVSHESFQKERREPIRHGQSANEEVDEVCSSHNQRNEKPTLKE